MLRRVLLPRRRTLHNYVRFEKDHPELAAPLSRAEIERILGHGAQGILSGRDR